MSQSSDCLLHGFCGQPLITCMIKERDSILAKTARLDRFDYNIIAADGFAFDTADFISDSADFAYIDNFAYITKLYCYIDIDNST